jgi:hypothetical protein
MLFLIICPVAHKPLPSVPEIKPPSAILNHLAERMLVKGKQDPGHSVMYAVNGPLLCGHLFQVAVIVLPAGTFAVNLAGPPGEPHARTGEFGERMGSYLGPQLR